MCSWWNIEAMASFLVALPSGADHFVCCIRHHLRGAEKFRTSAEFVSSAVRCLPAIFVPCLSRLHRRLRYRVALF